MTDVKALAAQAAAKAAKAAPKVASAGVEKTQAQKDAEKAALLENAVEAGEAPQDVIDLDGEDDDEDESENPIAADFPDWVTIPQNPNGGDAPTPPGWNVTFIRCKAKHTNEPRGADVWCALWNLTEADEKRATKRARGEQMRVIDELAKATIRWIGTVSDGTEPGTGNLVDLGGSLSSAGSLDAFWTKIGGKYRHVIKSIYLQNHTFTAAEHADFFESCVTVRRGG